MTTRLRAAGLQSSEQTSWHDATGEATSHRAAELSAPFKP